MITKNLRGRAACLSLCAAIQEYAARIRDERKVKHCTCPLLSVHAANVVALACWPSRGT